MGIGREHAENARSDYRLLIKDGESFYLEGKKVKIRMDEEGFRIGCTRMSWDVYRKLKTILSTGE